MSLSQVSTEDLLCLPDCLDGLVQQKRSSVASARAGMKPVVYLCDGALLWGRCLLESHKAAGGQHADVVQVNTVDRLTRLCIFLELENRPGTFAIDELATVAILLEGEIVDEDTRRQIAALLGLEWGQLLIARAWRSLSSIPAAWCRDGLVDLKTALQMESVPQQYWERSSAWMAAQSHSRRRMAVKLLCELGSYENEKRMNQLLQAAESASDPLEVLMMARMPQSEAGMRKIREIQADLGKKPELTISPPPNFEGDAWELRFRFRNKTELQRARKKLEQLEDRLDELLNLV